MLWSMVVQKQGFRRQPRGGADLIHSYTLPCGGWDGFFVGFLVVCRRLDVHIHAFPMLRVCEFKKNEASARTRAELELIS